MIEEIMNGLSTYYGLDYFSFIFGLIGTLLLTKKNKWGFIFTATSVASASIVAIIASQYGFILANGVSFVLLIRGFLVWNKNDPVQEMVKK